MPVFLNTTDPATAATTASILENVTEVFGEAIEMAGTAATTISGNPLLMVFWILPLVGLGIGILKRLK